MIFQSDTKSKSNKRKNKQRGPFQIKKLLHRKENHQQHEKVATKWETVFANETSYKGVISKIYKELIKLIKTQTIQLKTGQRM